MHLEGQDGQRGYAMAALLVSVGVLMVLMTVAMPVWRHEMQREREAELVFRGEQYARAINLYQRKAGPGNFPPTIDILVQQRFLRKKYKDPVTGADFQIIPVAAGLQQNPGQPQQPGGRGRGQGGLQPPGGRGSTQPPQGFGPESPFGAGGGRGAGQLGSQIGGAGQQGGGIMGVVSKSKEPSIRIYHGGTHYNEWTFLFSNVSNRPGAAGGRGVPGVGGGQRGGRGGGRGVGAPGGFGQPGGPGQPGGFGRPGGPGQPGGGRGMRPGGGRGPGG
ncbi:MAG: type II secretion system protein [Acidobacteriota bacterium]